MLRPPPRIRAGFALALCVLLLAASGSASAITQAGSLAAPEWDADLFQVTCTDDGSGAPASLALEVLAVSPSSTLVSAQIQKGTRATNTTDAVSGDGAPSPTATIDGGAGIYDVFVDKTDAGLETYELDVRCMTGAGGTGAESGTAITGSESVPAMPLAAWLALGGALALAARRWRS